ncbi:MAG TPA: chemotaxis protein CheA [Gemmatimonadales bacterium]|nr:chemotaxis protein CheA [Gemmatimonadales bacterium]
MSAPKYAALFLAESREHLAGCDRLLLTWERSPDAAEPVHGLFRAVHNIKGMAATMGYGPVADLAHRTENLLDALRSGQVSASADVIQLLFRAVDALRAGVEAVGAGVIPVAPADLTDALDTAAADRPLAAPAPEKSGHKDKEPPDQTAPHPPQTLRTVAFRIRPGASMRGARAIVALKRAETLGSVSAIVPPPAALERDDFDGRVVFQLESVAVDEIIADTLRAAADVATVEIGAATATAAQPAPATTARGRHIRVDLARLDAMMKQVGELTVARNRLVELARGADPTLFELSARIARLVSDLQNEVLASRMTPVGEAFERFPRLVRDLARDLGKRIRLDLEGEEIELDRAVLDELVEPLMHLVRNAADHGLETPAAREAAGKPPEGRLLIAASRERRTVAIRVSDDGRGIDRAAVLARAKRDGLADPAADTLSDELLLRVLARPGFSTAQEVTGLSGRGVGVEVALGRVRALGGTLEVRSEPGRGTVWTLRVPLTLAIVRALLAEAGGERYAVPLSFVAETVEFDPQAVTAIRQREALVVRERVIPTVHLRDLVAVHTDSRPPRRPTIILEVGERRTALVVDALLGQQDLVIEPFDAPRGLPAYVGGATILADGAPALILDAAALV